MKMKRHADQLMRHLDQLYATGTTFIPIREIYYWYGIERFSKTPWRDMKVKWEDLLGEAGEKTLFYPQVAEVPGGLLFIYNSKITRLDERAQ
jgi:hypothetical protein